MTTIINDLRWYRRATVRKAAASLNLTEPQLFQRARQEADGLAVWSAWKPGTEITPRGTANLNVDAAAAISADLAIST